MILDHQVTPQKISKTNPASAARKYFQRNRHPSVTTRFIYSCAVLSVNHSTKISPCGISVHQQQSLVHSVVSVNSGGKCRNREIKGNSFLCVRRSKSQRSRWSLFKSQYRQSSSSAFPVPCSGSSSWQSRQSDI